MKSLLLHHNGNLFIDHTVSGGLKQEFDTKICAHCGVVVVLNPDRVRARGYCPKCNAYTCDSPGCAEHIQSFEEVLDTLQNDAIKALGRG